MICLIASDAYAAGPGRRLANARVNAEIRTLRLNYPGPLGVWTRGFVARNEGLLVDAIRSQIPNRSNNSTGDGTDNSGVMKVKRSREADETLVQNIDAIEASTRALFGVSPPVPSVPQGGEAAGTRTVLPPGT